jgi:hypothetical protein
VVRNANDFARQLRLCTSALYVRAWVNSVRAALPIGRADLPPRLSGCSKDAQMLRKINEQQFATTSKRWEQNINNKAIFSREGTKLKAHQDISKALFKARNEIEADLKEIDSIVAKTEAAVATAEQNGNGGLMLELTVSEDGSTLTAARVV